MASLLFAFVCFIMVDIYVTAQCPLGLEQMSVCVGSSQPTCDNKQVSITNCQNRHVECRCPASSPFKWGSQCYKDYECPKKDHDAPSNNRTGHNFVVPGKLRNDGSLYGMHISALKLPPHWYHAIALFRFQDLNCVAAAKKAQADNPTTFLSINYLVPTKLADLLVKGKKIDANIGLGAGPAFRFVRRCELKVEEVLDLRRYKAYQHAYPQFQKYFLFGKGNEAFISHLPTKCFDSQQLVSVKLAPSALSNFQLRRGLVIEIPSLSGQPSFDNNNFITDPLTAKEYDVTLPDGSQTEISIGSKYTFDYFIINIGC